jgi:hypothetical protein
LHFLPFKHRSKKLEEYIATLENNVKLKSEDIIHLEDDISTLKSQKSQVSAEMTAVNQVSVSLIQLKSSDFLQ